MDHPEKLINELVKLLNGGGAHATLDHALKGLQPELRGVKVEKLPYNIWQLVEHIRIAQWDMLEFNKSAKHESPDFPSGYWVKEVAPADEAAWQRSLKQINDDLEEFKGLLKGDIYTAFPHGEGQSLLREALQIADHNAYHIGEIIMIRRLLGAWG